MTTAFMRADDLALRLAEAEATIAALVSSQVDAVFHPASQTPVLLATAQDALRQSEERYRRIVETANEGVWQIDADSRTTFMNLRMARMLGCEADMGVGRTPFEFLADDQRDKLEDHLKSPSVHQMEICFTCTNGASVWALLEATPFFDGAGRYDGSLAMVMDITERRLAEDALRASEARFRRLWDSGIILISISEMAGKIKDINDAGLRMIGYTREDVRAGLVGWQDLTAPEWSGADDDALAQLEATGKSSPWEKEIIRKDGTRVPILAARASLAGEDGISIAIDMTERKLAEATLRSTERQYREIVEATSDGIVKVDAEERIVFVNRRFGAMFGYVPSELIGTSILDLMGPDARLEAPGVFARRRRGESDAHDSTLCHKDGTELSVHVSGSPLLDAEGAYAGSLALVRDMSESRKLQAQLMVSDRMASMGTLAAGVAHEINNPLTAVVANLEYISESLRGLADAGSPARSDAWLREEIKSPLDDAREGAQRVRLIVRDLRMFSRSPAAEPAGSVDVKAILQSSLRMARNEIRHRAHLIEDYGDVPRVAANEARLGQVFLNLIVNAAQAMPAGRAHLNEIGVRTRLEGERVVIDVSDTGVGIPPESIGRIFDAFYTTKPVGVGTGLGLAICQRIVTDMGGQLTVHSETGKGSTFRVALPIAPERTAGAPVAGAETVIAPRRGRILVVDDDVPLLRLVERLLSKDHEVVTANSAAEALRLCLAGSTFDLILCDLMMPDMTGMDLDRELSAALPAQAAKIVFFTGGAFTDDAQDFLRDTTREQIEKPFDVGNLCAIVQRHLERAALVTA